MSNWASFAPTPAELAYAGQIFNSADPQKLGVVTGEAAVPLLNGSNLSPDKLGEIWAIADHENNGFLSRKGVAVAVRLIGWAQFGEPVTDSLLLKGESISMHARHDQSKQILSSWTSPHYRRHINSDEPRSRRPAYKSQTVAAFGSPCTPSNHTSGPCQIFAAVCQLWPICWIIEWYDFSWAYFMCLF